MFPLGGKREGDTKFLGGFVGRKNLVIKMWNHFCNWRRGEGLVIFFMWEKLPWSCYSSFLQILTCVNLFFCLMRVKISNYNYN